MYLWLRNIHLWLGLLCGLPVLVYGVSAVQMAHGKWFDMKPAVTETQVPLLGAATASPRSVARALMDSHGMRGELGQVKETPAAFRFRIARPGTVYEVDFDRAAGTAKVRTSTARFMGMLNRIHHVAGLSHEYVLLDVWGALVAFVSLSMLVLGATGIYLWFKLHAERKVGLVLLAASLSFALPLVVLLRLA